MKIKLGNDVIEVHSNIDVITNSSTEIFSRATDGTLLLIKEIAKELDPTIDFEVDFFYDFLFNEWKTEDIRRDRIEESLYNEYKEDPPYKLVDKQLEIMNSIPGAFDKEECKIRANENCDNEDGDIELYVSAKTEKGEKLLPLIKKIIYFGDSYEAGEYYG